MSEAGTPPRPTDAELAILRVLWRCGPSTVRAVREQLHTEPGQGVGYTTVLKLLQIMAEKGLVERDESSRAHVYAAREQATRTQRRLVGDLLSRAFDGAASKMVMQALSVAPTTAEEIDQIRRYLDALEGDGRPIGATEEEREDADD